MLKYVELPMTFLGTLLFCFQNKTKRLKAPYPSDCKDYRKRMCDLERGTVPFTETCGCVMPYMKLGMYTIN